MRLTTGGCAVGNLGFMPARRLNWNRSPAQRRRTFITEWREFRGLSQERLAELLDTTKGTISRIENMKIGYTQDFLEGCADMLGTHPAILLSRPPRPDDDMPVPPAGARARRPASR